MLLVALQSAVGAVFTVSHCCVAVDILTAQVKEEGEETARRIAQEMVG
jgi:hypothetical protein